MTQWRQVLAALNDDTLADATRTRILAQGAARLAANRAPEGQHATPQDVMAIAFWEFSLLLDTSQAHAALKESGRTHGQPRQPGGR